MIGRALARLSDRDRSIVLMREVHGLSYEEIATSVDLPLGTVKAALHRARERLRRELAGAGVRP
jgi:RNA polymerase sigma-70 factor (ECF subfamily)